jgi:hypothetical protein
MAQATQLAALHGAAATDRALGQAAAAGRFADRDLASILAHQAAAADGEPSRAGEPTLSSRIDGGRPGRGSSASPSSRRAANLPRHLLTVAGSTRRPAAACLFVAPSAQASTILARSASAWELLARRAHRVS